MDRRIPILRGRGTPDDLPNRFERLHVELDPEEMGDPHQRPTQYFKDASRSVLTRNDSPDVGFDWSLNPYRGCTHGCTYCLAPETPILHADFVWRPLWEVSKGDELVGFDEYPPEPGLPRKLRPTVVEAIRWSRKPTLKIRTERTEVVTTAEHLWLQHRSFRWSRTDQLSPGRSLRFLQPLADEEGDEHYRMGTMPPTSPERILSIDPGPVMDVIDIQTSTRTFYAGGLATHNCYARPTHEYLGFSPGLDFESKILVKKEAPALLERHLSRPKWVPAPIVMSGVTDPYQPIERKLRVTRGCLEVFARTRHPVAIITKSRLVERDADLLAELAAFGAAHVTLSITTLDRRLQRALEPRASPPEHRLEAIRTLAAAGVPVAVNVAPIIPGLTDHEIPDIIDAAAAAGASDAGYTLLRLPGAVEPLFLAWMEEHIPGRAGKVRSRLLDLRGGVLNVSTFGKRMRGEGPFAEQIRTLVEVARRRAGLGRRALALSVEHFQRPERAPIESDSGDQLRLL